MKTISSPNPENLISNKAAFLEGYPDVDNADKSTWLQTSAGEFWLPGTHLTEQEFPEATDKKLASSWQDYCQGDAVVSSTVCGVFSQNMPKRPDFILSVDVDEVLRETGVFVRELHNLADTAAHYDYSRDSWFETAVGGYNLNRSVVESSILAGMNQNLIGPVEERDRILKDLERASSLGGLVVANTSTLHGTELSTIRFLNQNFPNVFDGIIFPGNHDGSGALSKSKAIKAILRESSVRPIRNMVIHVDDALHHLESFRADEVSGKYDEAFLVYVNRLWQPNERAKVADIEVSDPSSAFSIINYRLLAETEVR